MGKTPKRDAPPRLKSVEACQRCLWCRRIWKKSDPSTALTIPFTCKSWRCPGDCREKVAKQDFARVCEAIKTRSDWTYFVFTYDQRAWHSQWDMYAAGGLLWDHLRKRIIRQYGKIAYIQTWEAHRSGAPHVNVLIGNDAIHFMARTWPKDHADPWFVEHATASGFGEQLRGSPMRSRENMTWYLVKLANELSGAGEKDQTPINAPRHFRRLRASQKLLPPRFKDEEWTGKLFQMTVEKWTKRKAYLKACP